MCALFTLVGLAMRTREVNESAPWSSSSTHRINSPDIEQFFQRTVMVATVPFQDELAKPSWSWSSEIPARWPNDAAKKNSPTRTSKYYSHRSFVIPKSEAVAEERSSVEIHPIQCLLQWWLPLLSAVKRKCCSTGGNISLSKWSSASSLSLHTQYPSHSWSVQRWFWTFFFSPRPQSSRHHRSYFVVVILLFPIHFLSHRFHGSFVHANSE